MGIAVTLAQTVGLHRDPQDLELQPNQKSLYRRIWWACLMRDRMIGFALGRSSRIRDGDFDVPMLDLEDFRANELSPAVMEMLGICSSVHGGEESKQLAMIYIEKVKLCLCNGNLPMRQASIGNHGIDCTTGAARTFSNADQQAESDDGQVGESAIQTWYQQLPQEVLYRSGDLGENKSKVVLIHQALIGTFYLSSCIRLHFHQLRATSSSEGSLLEVAPSRVRQKLRGAATETTKILHEMTVMNLTKYLPVICVTDLLLAMVIHLLDARSDDANLKRSGLKCCQQSVDVLQQLHEIHEFADYESWFLNAVMERRNVPAVDGPHAFGLRRGSVSEIFGGVANSPPETCVTEALPGPFIGCEQPKKSDETLSPTLGASLGQTVPASYMDGTPIGNVSTDRDFDELFNLDASVDSLEPSESSSRYWVLDGACNEEDFSMDYEIPDVRNATQFSSTILRDKFHDELRRDKRISVRA